MIDREFCPYFQGAVELLGRRFCGAIARALLDGPRRFSELERAIPGISARMLTQRLRELQAEAIVEQREGYALTEKGRSLADIVEAVERWAHAWLEPARASDRGLYSH